MSLYSQVLVAIDPFAECDEILIKAKKLLTTDGSIDLIYVMDLLISFPGAPFAPPMLGLPGVHEKTKDSAMKALAVVADKYHIKQDHIHLPTGSVAKEVRALAVKTKADAIVIGSHGRHGIGLLLGSTASAVIHGSPCDILVVRISAKK